MFYDHLKLAETLTLLSSVRSHQLNDIFLGHSVTMTAVLMLENNLVNL